MCLNDLIEDFIIYFSYILWIKEEEKKHIGKISRRSGTIVYYVYNQIIVEACWQDLFSSGT